MQSLMLDHVMRCRNAMFKDSCAAVKRELDKVLREARDDLNTAADMVSDEISRDYRSTFSGKDLRPGQALPRWHREMRKGVLDVLRNMQEYLTSDTRSSNGDDDNAAAMQLRMEYTTIKTEDKDEEMRSDSDATGKLLLSTRVWCYLPAF